MSSRVTVTVTGFDELQDKLNRLPAEFSRRALRVSLRAGGVVFRNAIKPLAKITGKYATGWLASNVVVRTKTNNYDEGEVKVSFSRKTHPDGNVTPIYEALYAELGTVHEPAREFIRPAFESSKGEALDAFTERLRIALEQTFS